MPDRTSKNTADALPENIINVTSTLPPANRGMNSGKFRISIRDRIKNSGELLNPNIGGYLLMEQPSWSLLPPEIKNEIESGMLEFIATNPIPEDESIENEITSRACIAAKQLEVKKVLSGNRLLPEVIAVAIHRQMEQEIMNNPDLTIEEIMGETIVLANEAVNRVTRETVEKEHQSGRYCLIAHDVLNRRITAQKKDRVVPMTKTDPDMEEMEDTMPDTPMAKRDLP